MSKKNSLFLFILICLFVFVGIDRVEADQLGDNSNSPITCLYRKYSSTKDTSVNGWFLLTDTGNQTDVYFNPSSMLYTDSNWKKLEDTNLNLGFDINWDGNAAKINGEWSCPRYMYKYLGNLIDGKVHFGDNLKSIELGDNVSLGFSNVYVDLINTSYASFEDLNSGKEKFTIIGKEEIRNGYTLREPVDGYKTCMFVSCSSSSICERIIQLDFNDTDFKYYTNFIKDGELNGTMNMISIIDLNSFSGSCPLELFVADAAEVETLSPITNTIMNWYISSNIEPPAGVIGNMPWESYVNVRKKGDKTTIVHEGNIIPIESCSDLLSSDALDLIKGAITLVKILVPIALIVFGIADFGMAVFSGKEDDMKKKATKFGKRVIIAIIIFFVPSLMELLLTIASKIWDFIDPTLCGIFE